MTTTPHPDVRIAAPQVRERLRQATDELHQRLERRFDPVHAFDDAQRHDTLRRRYTAILAPAQRALAPWLATVPSLDFHARMGARGSDAAGHAAPAFPLPQSKAAALGMLYVLEGSTLGGRLIRRRIEASGGGSDLPIAFIDPYGDSTGQRWRDFLTVLEREVKGEAALAEAVEGAVAAFLHVEHILCGGPS